MTVNPVRAFLAAIGPLRTIPVAVLCETCGTIRPRISSAEAEVLGNPHLPRQIACRTKGCRGHAKPLRINYGDGEQP